MAYRFLKKLGAILLATLIFTGCSARDANIMSPAPEKIRIAASFYPVYIMLLNITMKMPDVEVIDMTQSATGCLHDYAVTTDDMKNLSSADFFIINGAGMESFMDRVIQQFPDLMIIDSSVGIPLISGEGDEGVNPHIWVSISNCIQQVKNIGGQLAAMDSSNAAKYTENTDAYIKKLEAERDRMHNALDGLTRRDIITFHEAFPYFAQEFSLNIVGVIEREPGSEPSAKEIGDTIDLIKSNKADALFAEPQYLATAAETIAQETGFEVYALDPAVTGPMDADAYLNIMNSNLEVLIEALS